MAWSRSLFARVAASTTYSQLRAGVVANEIDRDRGFWVINTGAMTTAVMLARGAL